MTEKIPQKNNMPGGPQPTPTDKRINPVPDEEERAEREADKLAHKGVEREQEETQKPFTI